MNKTKFVMRGKVKLRIASGLERIDECIKHSNWMTATLAREEYEDAFQLLKDSEPIFQGRSAKYLFHKLKHHIDNIAKLAGVDVSAIQNGMNEK